jgi:CRISPR/Cas system CSM-associated protein Csm2 small subunit
MDNKEREVLERIISKLMDMEHYIRGVDYAVSELFEYNRVDRDAFGEIDDIIRLHNEIVEDIKSVESLREIYEKIKDQRRKEALEALKRISEELPKASTQLNLSLAMVQFLKKVIQKIEEGEKHEK